MKVFVITVLSLWIFTGIVQFICHVKDGCKPVDFFSNIFGLVVAVLALIFTCVGW